MGVPKGIVDGEVTQLLRRWGAGDEAALKDLTPLVYAELRRLGRSTLRRDGGQSVLQPTALVDEVWLRLARKEQLSLETRGQFFALAAKMMRDILVDQLRRRQAAKRGGSRIELALEDANLPVPPRQVDFLILDEAMNRLGEIKARYTEIVELRYLAGLTIGEAAEVLQVSHATIERVELRSGLAASRTSDRGARAADSKGTQSLTPDRWSEVERLFHEAMQLSPGERAAFAANIGDPAMRGEVLSLLAAEEGRDTSVIESVIGKAAQSVLNEPLRGDMLGHFRVIREIGRGAMGEVYLAQDVNLGRQVALKLLPTAFQEDDERLRRFEREARAAAALNHPNIMAVYEIGEWEGRRFIAAEYVDGETLAECLRSGALPAREAIRVAAQVAEALASAHERGVVHRDLKPANIKLTPQGNVKVLDFGLAKLTGEPSLRAGSELRTDTLQPTRTGAIMGTATHMSPEQARGLPTDKRTDIWSFGVVLYEMVAGTSPSERDTLADTLAAVVKEEPDLTALPASLRTVIGRCLSKDVRALAGYR